MGISGWQRKKHSRRNSVYRLKLPRDSRRQPKVERLLSPMADALANRNPRSHRSHEPHITLGILLSAMQLTVGRLLPIFAFRLLLLV